jgi:NAD(P)-dependent dehydrogenase (short-subunit alcohol dehydrogenase family)
MPQPAANMHGKVCLVTGGTSGIGLETARGLAILGAQVVLTGRDPLKTSAAVEDIRASTGNPHVEGLQIDMASQSEVRQAAAMFCTRHDRLDVLVNNAGAVHMVRQLSPDGIELTLAVNHLAYFLFTQLLLDRLLASRPARIVIVSSFAHGYSNLDFLDDLHFTQNYHGWQAYSRSKLANLLFTYELAHKLEGAGVTANALHPGFVNSNIGKNNTPEQLADSPLRKPGHLTNEEGARTSIYAAASPEVEGLNGAYFDDCRVSKSSDVSYDHPAAERLWQISADLTHLPPDYVENLLKKTGITQ